MEKTCSKCDVVKPLSEFYKSPLAADGHFRYCVPCHKVAGSKWKAEHRIESNAQTRKCYLRNLDKRRESNRAYKAKYRDKLNARMRERRLERIAENPTWEVNRNLKAKYGITLADYEMRLASQGGVCAICKEARKTSDNRRLPVDHNHATGQVREILCQNCNFIIGLATERVSVLRAAADYLEHHQQIEANIALHHYATEAT